MKLKIITDASDANNAQIFANSQALINLQTQLDQVVATNTATKTAIDANNALLDSLMPNKS